jgi:mono/diheme cytochrome c family protein
VLRGRSLGALWTRVAFVCLLPARAGHPEEPPKFRNPFAGNPQAVKEGRTLYMTHGCSGCHGLLGGGGMGKPILDDTWAFGSDDETLFKLTRGELPQQTMPKSEIGLTDEQVWKVLAYVRSLYKGDPSLINWGLKPTSSPTPSPSPSPSALKPPKP